MKYSHSFHSLEAEKGPMSFTLEHTHSGIVGTKSPPPPQGFTHFYRVTHVCSSAALGEFTSRILTFLATVKIIKNFKGPENKSEYYRDFELSGVHINSSFQVNCTYLIEIIDILKEWCTCIVLKIGLLY